MMERCSGDAHIFDSAWSSPAGCPSAGDVCECGRFVALDNHGSIIPTPFLDSGTSGRCDDCGAPWDDHPRKHCKAVVR